MKNISIAKLIDLLFLFLLFLMISFPAIFQGMKFIVLILLLGLISIRVIKYPSNLSINKEIFSIFIILMICQIFFMFNGYLNGYENAYKLLTVNLLWPILWILFILNIKSYNILSNIDNVMKYSFYFIVLYFYYFMLHEFSIIPESLFINFERSDQSGLYFGNGELEVSINALSSLMYLIPFFLVYTLFENKQSMIYYFLFIFGIFATIISGRRGLQITIPIALIMIILLKNFIGHPSLKRDITSIFRKFLILGILVFVIIFIYLTMNNIIDFTKILDFMIAGFDFSDTSNESSYTRYLVFNDLISKWSTSSLFGLGFSAHGDIIRNQEMPWNYELTYIAILLQTGLVGILVYSFSILWINYNLFIIIRHGTEQYIKSAFALLVALDTFLISSATNSYLMKFDYLFTIFLPIVLINLYKLKIGRT